MTSLNQPAQNVLQMQGSQQMTTVLHTSGDYSESYPFIDSAHPYDIMQMHHNLNEFNQKTGRKAHITQCLSKSLRTRIAGKLEPPCHIADLPMRHPEAIYKILIELWDPHTPTEFQEQFFQKYPKNKLNKDVTISHFSENVIDPLIQYVFEFRTVIELALMCKNKEAIPPVNKDKTGISFGNTKEDKISLLKMFDYAVGGTVVSRLHKHYNAGLSGILTQNPASFPNYLNEFIACLKASGEEINTVEPIFNAWQSTFAQSKNPVDTLHAMCDGDSYLNEVSNKPGVCYHLVNGNPCPSVAKKEKCPHSHDPREIKEFREQRIMKLKNLNENNHRAPQIMKPPGQDPRGRLNNMNSNMILSDESEDEEPYPDNSDSSSN